MSISSSSFGRLSDGTEVTAYMIRNGRGASVTILDYGATLQSLVVPNAKGGTTDVLLGYDTPVEYETSSGHLGGTIGRVGNRIKDGEFSLNGVTYTLAKNNGPNHLHGGKVGFDHIMWKAAPEGENSLVCTRLSPDGEEGYPGNLSVKVTFTLDEKNALHILYEADTDKDTIVNLTNHAYFNLNGGGSVLDHTLRMKADRFCENDEGSLPTGRLLPVEGTPFDFRKEKKVGADIDADDEQLRRGKGYDHNFVMAGRKAAVVHSDETGITMKVKTDMPGMQVYSANGLSERAGKGGSVMGPRQAICLETQLFPNAMNCYGFPSPVLRAGSHLCSETVYKFSC